MRPAVPFVALALSGAVGAAAWDESAVRGHGSLARPQAAPGVAPLVRRGEWVVMSTSQGGVAVESRVEVLQDGKAGQRVLVRASAWPQPIAARVLGAGSVEPSR